MSGVEEKKVSLAINEEQPTSPRCIWCSARTVALISAYSVIPIITCLMIYFVAMSKEADLTITEKDTLIATTCFLSVLIVGFATAFIYGMTYERRYFMIPFICGSVLTCFAASVVLVGGVVWEKSHGLWQSKPVDMSLITAASAILTLCEVYLLVSYIRCYLYFRKLEQYKANVDAAA